MFPYTDEENDWLSRWAVDVATS